MKTDKTTKVLLGIIAASLVWIAVNMTMPAAAEPEIISVDIQRIDGQRIYRTALPVRIVQE